MARWRDDLRRLLGGRMLLRGIYQELRETRRELARLAAAVEYLAEQAYPRPAAGAHDPTRPDVEVSYVDTQVQAEFMDIELQLTSALGQPPSERQVLEEYQVRHPEQDHSAAIAAALAQEREAR